MNAAKLYTPDLLALAVELSDHPPLATASVSARGEARSPACGSTLALDLALDGAGRIEALGLKVQACAVGQAAAAIFARHAKGRDAVALEAMLHALEHWLAGAGERPDWPDLHLLDAAQAYPGRHGAILLPWRAALAALSTCASAG